MAGRVLLAVLAALLVSAWFGPVVVAQLPTTGSTSVSMALPTLPRPVAPGSSDNFTATIRYQWNQAVSPQDTEIRLEVVDQPTWLNSTFSPEVVTVAPFPAPGIASLQSQLFIDVAPDAPAFEQGVATYRVIAEENGPLPRAEDEIEFEITAGFSGNIDVSLPNGDAVTAWGGLVTEVPIQVENRGNGPLLVNLSVLRKPAESRIHLPEDFQVGVNGSQRSTTVNVEVLVPWKVSESGTVEIQVNPTHLQRGVPDQSRTVAFELDGNSAVPIPGPGPWLALLAVALAVLVTQRTGSRRRR